LEPNDTPPGGSPSRTITIHLTRDTLLLIAALAFLAIAILLAVIFPAASSSNSNSANTSAAQATTEPAATGRQTTEAIPIGGGSAIPTAASGAGQAAGEAPNATPALPASQGSYPVPNGAAATQSPTAPSSSAIGSVATSSPDVPVFSPNTPTGAAVAIGVEQAETPYPGPAGTVTLAQQTPTTGLPGATPTRTPALFQPQPTNSPLPEVSPTEQPTAQPLPTNRPAATPRPPPTPTPVPVPTAVPVDVLRGNIRWTAAQSPIRLNRDQQLVRGATLIIEPGVEVRLAPGVSFFVEGTLYALGKADRPVRIVASDRQRWEGLFGRPGSNIALEYTEIHGGGAGGTLLTSEGGNLVLHNAHVNDNGGHIQVTDSRLEMRDSEIAGNDMPYGAALDASYSSGGFVIMTNNRIGGNRQQIGSPPVLISNQSTFDTVNLDVQRNLLVGQDSPDLVLSTNGPLQGGLTCNTLVGGTDGLSLRTETPQVPGFALNVRDNATEKHTPPIIPIYLKYGIGRGATSEIALDMRNNWWGSPLGPYDPERYADGRGEAVGDNIDFAPWLTSRPACAPTQ
jgi:hypothetical protein